MAGMDFKEQTRRARELGARLTPIQKVVMGAALLTLVVGGLVLSRSGGDTQMAALYTDLEPADAATIVDELSAQGVAYDLTGAGRTILVPKDQVYDLRVSLSSQGLPSSNEGYALLDKQGITTSEFRQHIDYQRALEGELSRTLEAMDGIDNATVHLALPEESVFVDEPGKATASVLVATRANGGIVSDQVQAIIHLVASSVKDMQPEDVTVIDSAGAVLSAAGISSGAGGGDARVKAQSTYEQQLTTSLNALLARVAGPNAVSVSVRAELDLDERQATSETYDPSGDAGTTAVVAEQVATETYSGTGGSGAAATGVLGPDGAVVTPAAAAGANSYEKEDANRTYALDRTVEQVTTAPGSVTKLHVAVLLDEANIDAAQATAIEEMVATAAGIDADRGDELVVTRLPFDTSTASAATEAAAAEEAAVARSEMMALIRTVVIGLVILIALFLAYRSTRRARRVVATPIDIGEIESRPMAVGLPAGDGTSALPVAVPADDGLMDMAMHNIASMADRKPQEVASVLRSWLSESNGRR
ncbi:MAG: flagellar basal-body MS-ring/collar protein FliF [Acidimicrobiia bacterium]